RYALTMLTLEMGYPHYLKTTTEDEAQKEVAKEAKDSLTNYIKKKDSFKRKKESSMDKVSEGTSEEDLINLLPGVEIVQMDFIKDEVKEKEFDGEEFTDLD